MFLIIVMDTRSSSENPHRHGENMQIPSIEALFTHKINPGPSYYEATMLTTADPTCFLDFQQSNENALNSYS